MKITEQFLKTLVGNILEDDAELNTARQDADKDFKKKISMKIKLLAQMKQVAYAVIDLD